MAPSLLGDGVAMPQVRRGTALVRAALVAALLVPAGCAVAEPLAGPPETSGVADASGFGPLQTELRARVEAPDRSAPWYRVIEELLPNTLYAPPGDVAAPLTDCVASGTVTGVERGPGNRRGKRDTWVAADFDDPKAWTRTVQVSFAVDDQLGSAGCGSGSATGSTVRFGLVVGPELSFEDAEAGLRAMATIVVFLARSPVFAYDPTLYGVVLDGGMIADVNETDGTLTLPFVGADRARGLLATTTSLEELAAAGRERGSTIAIRLDGDRMIR